MWARLVASGRQWLAVGKAFGVPMVCGVCCRVALGVVHRCARASGVVLWCDGGGLWHARQLWRGTCAPRL